jgi:NAD(P)-dependent dehydrogenase (short-subunit alcohol dehydrogenase family)
VTGSPVPADAEEIAGAVTFLASPAVGYVNGSTVSAMGGMPALG